MSMPKYKIEAEKRNRELISKWEMKHDIQVIAVDYNYDNHRDSNIRFKFNSGVHKDLVGETTIASAQQNRVPTTRMLTTDSRDTWLSELCKLIGGEYVGSTRIKNYKTLIEFKVTQGVYKGYSATAHLTVIQRAIKNGNLINGYQNLTDESKAKYIYDLSESEGYTVLSLPIGLKMTERVKLVCPNGHTREMIWDNFHRGARCAECKLESRGERLVATLLKELGVDFHQQYPTVPKNGTRPQFFDFYIPSTNTAIEFNGRQHYEPVNAFGGEKEFVKTVERDTRKKEYCEENDINLVVINHTMELDEIKLLLELVV